MGILSKCTEVFLLILLIFSLFTFTWAIIDTRGSVDAVPVQNTGMVANVAPVASQPVSDSVAVDAEDSFENDIIFQAPHVEEEDEEPEQDSAPVQTVTFSAPRLYLGSTRGVQDKVENEGSARVIASFDNAGDKDAALDIINDLDADVHTEWSDGFAVTADADILAALEDNAMIEEDLPLHTMTYEGFDLIDLEKVLANDILTLDDPFAGPTTKLLAASGTYSLTGSGQTVAVIDSGISWDHQEFTGKVIAQWDFDENDDSAQDSWNHGTRMAGVIAAKGVNMDGVAPDADIVALRITNSTGGGFRSYLYQALDWVANNASKYNITTVYVGVGDGLYIGTESDCDDSFVYLKINELTNNNITVVAPSGHDSNTTMIAYPACVANTISVGAVTEGKAYPADQWNLTGVGGVQSNRRDGLLDLLAPGGVGGTKTTNRTNYGGTNVGTSVSAAYVAGASILLREFWDADNWNFRPAGLVNGNIPNTIEYIFKQTGVQVDDENNPGVSYPRLDFFAAINYEENNPVVMLVTANETTEVEGTITLEYNVTDQHEITSCSLYVNGVLNQTDNSVTRDITETFNIALGVGVYNWSVECEDTATVPNTGVSAENMITVNSGADTTPPVISNVSESVFNDSATITWNTDEGANNSQANYGLTTALGTVIGNVDQSLRTNHGIGLINLIPNTTYFYNVTSCDAAGNCATDGSYNFTTLPNVVANQPPVISGIPDNETDEDIQPPLDWVDLWSYASDPDNATADLTFAVASNSNPLLIDCFVVSNRYVRCSTPAANQSGFSDINVSVYDGEYYDYDTFRVTVNPVDDPAVWNTLSNQEIDENSLDGTVVYPNLGNQCSDIDSLVSIIPSASIHYILGFSGNDLIVNSLEADWFGTETVDLDCNGISNSFDLTVNDVAETTCYQVCTYGKCYDICV